jgi:purine-nucleoside phosphorylase
MSKIPLLRGYSETRVLVSPKQQIKNFIKNHKLKLKSLPSICIISAMNPKRVEKELSKSWNLKKEIKLSPNNYTYPIKIYKKNKKELLFTYGGGIGPSALCDKLELLIALGVMEVYIIGMCGGIQKNLKIGDVIVVTDAVRDEGVSYHYLKALKKAKADKRMLNLLKSKIKKAYFGKIWTTDAMYREPISKYRKYKKEGILGIDMETSSAYAVGLYRKIKVVSLLVVSDMITPKKWNPQFHSEIIEKNIHNIINSIFN